MLQNAEDVGLISHGWEDLKFFIHLRIFAYTSNTLIASFEYMDCMLASGTLNNICVERVIENTESD